MYNYRQSSLHHAEVEYWWWSARIRREDRRALRRVHDDIRSGKLPFDEMKVNDCLDHLNLAGPKARAGLLQKMKIENVSNFLLLLLFGNQRALCTWNFLRACNKACSGATLVGGSSDQRRDKTVIAARAADEFYQDYPPLWPFHDDDAPVD